VLFTNIIEDNYLGNVTTISEIVILLFYKELQKSTPKERIETFFKKRDKGYHWVNHCMFFPNPSLLFLFSYIMELSSGRFKNFDNSIAFFSSFEGFNKN